MQAQRNWYANDGAPKANCLTRCTIRGFYQEGDEGMAKTLSLMPVVRATHVRKVADAATVQGSFSAPHAFCRHRQAPLLGYGRGAEKAPEIKEKASGDELHAAGGMGPKHGDL